MPLRIIQETITLFNPFNLCFEKRFMPFVIKRNGEVIKQTLPHFYYLHIQQNLNDTFCCPPIPPVGQGMAFPSSIHHISGGNSQLLRIFPNQHIRAILYSFNMFCKKGKPILYNQKSPLSNTGYLMGTFLFIISA